MKKPNAPKKAKTPKRASRAPLSPSAFHNKRVRLCRVTEGQGVGVQEYELLRRIGKEGLADCLDSQGRFAESVSVLFDDGCRLMCLPEELELCPAEAAPTPTVISNAELSYVQACIAHVSFPTSLAGLKEVFEGHDDTSMEKLLWPPDNDVGGWTAPRWLTAGDIIFFYHTKKALQRITRLLKTADADAEPWNALADPESAFQRLADQLEIAQEYAGTIFACARVTGAATYWRNDDVERDRDRHWRSNIYAEISRANVFVRPLTEDSFRPHLTISPGGAITPVHGSTFERLKQLLGEKNQLPDYFVNARPGGASFRNVDAKNWIDISCSSRARFIDESQLRTYLLDYLLEELKDPRTTVHQECRCRLDQKYRSIADYFVRVHGRWVPVEAKLNVRAERDLPGQVSKYLGVTQFSPTRGPRAGEVLGGSVASMCLVADVAGVYLLDTNGYVSCGPEQPLWERTLLTSATISAIRERLR